jgi:glutathione S-transferase
MELYDNALSPYALKLRLILYEKGLDFEKHEIETEDQRAELLRVSPRGEVPALVDGGVALYDSKVIAEYLEERSPERPLLPRDPASRARCRRLELIADTELDAAVVVVALFRIFRPELATAFPEEAGRAVAVLEQLYGALDRELAGDFFLGAFSRADVAFAPFVATAAFTGVAPDERTPRLAAWLARMNERPSVQRAMQEAMEAYARSQSLADPLFATQRLHWRSDRIEQLVRIGLGRWLLDELAADRAFLPPVREA